MPLSNEPWFYSRSAPGPEELASIFNLVGLFQPKIFRMAADVIKVFNFSIASNWVFSKAKTKSFFKGARSGGVSSARFEMNFTK